MNIHYSKAELTDLLGRLNWDTTLSKDDFAELLLSDRPEIKGFRKVNLYIKILNFYRWHEVRKIVPAEKHAELLSEEVIKGVFPRDLREKYRYVRSLL
jgi:hypothetical protein